MEQAWWILFSPFVAFLTIQIVPERTRTLAGWIAFTGIFISFLLTVQFAIPLFQAGHLDPHVLSLEWIGLSQLKLSIGVLIDSLSVLMLLVVTGVGSAIFFYSLEYMSHDEGYRRYFSGLSLFAFSMIGIVISSNLLQLFIFWELVGLSSYLLIGHWYQKESAADAGKKAFLVNRVGDFGFLMGILLLWTLSGPAGYRTLDLLSLNEVIPPFVQGGIISQATVTAAMILIFLGVMGKSAQFPLHVWLPDAMEGPTPVSALIHAATMVAAGVYLLARTFALYAQAPVVLELIAYLGAFTALFAATQALVQSDIKRILAYSTLSQLGYMVLAIGLGSVSVGMYHLITHAFFKALLFLAAGSLIHAVGTQNIFEMGGITRKLPLTSFSFFIGTFALVGFWPASGFWSKDEILALAFSENAFLFWIATSTVFLTAFYMGRAVYIAFFGPARSRKRLHEPRHKIWLPLIVLSFLSLTAGYFGIEKLLHHPLDRVFEANHFVVLLATTLGVLGLASSVLLYARMKKERNNLQDRFQWFIQVLLRKYYVDEVYDWVLAHIQQPIAEFFDWCERRLIVEGAVNGSATLTRWAGSILRKFQTGNVQTYVALFCTGVVFMVYFIVVRHG
jgi:NADH-quinone oxidoreductase subunit L